MEEPFLGSVLVGNLSSNTTATASLIRNASVAAASHAAATFSSRPNDGAAPSSWIGLMGNLVGALLRMVPGIVFWLVPFLSITLPTWLFTLFSTSLTFTMNFTTL